MAVANGARRMKVVRALLLATVVFAATSAGAQRAIRPGAESSFLVERGRAGVFEVGMPIDDAQAIAGIRNTKLVAQYPEGQFQPELQISLPGFSRGPAITAGIASWPCGLSLASLVVRDPRYKTSRGIGVGSTLADIRKFAPSAKIGNFNADGFPGVFSAEPGISFAFGNAVEGGDPGRVTGLLVYDSPNLRSRRCPDDDDRAAVYQEVLTNVIAPRTARFAETRPVFLLAETKHLCDATSLKPLENVGCLPRSVAAPFLQGKLAEDFWRRNSGRYQVPMLKGATALITSAGLSQIGPPVEQRVTVTFSSPGFDDGRAVVFVSYGCGMVCGEGLLVLLELADDKWRVASVRMISVSGPSPTGHRSDQEFKWLK
jgi:hypothetical protein